MSGLDWLCLVIAGVGLLMILLSPFARTTDGYHRPLDPLGSASYAEREFSRWEAAHNRNPRLAMIKGGAWLIASALLFKSLSWF